MHAIIRQGNGKYYVSAVFGYYKDITTTDDYEKYLQEIHNPYCIVWDADRKRLIRQQTMVPNTDYLIPQLLIIDTERSNWTMDEDGVGCVEFLSRSLLDSFLDMEEQPKEILEQCRAMDDGYVYEEMKEIRTETDVANLMEVSGWFHDASIAKEELMDDGTLYLRFKGTWGCEIEVWFWGDVEYDTSSRNPEEADPYWYGSTIIMQDGFVYFVDEENMTVDKIGPGYCYFKARHMKYRVIPN